MRQPLLPNAPQRASFHLPSQHKKGKLFLTAPLLELSAYLELGNMPLPGRSMSRRADPIQLLDAAKNPWPRESNRTTVLH